MDWLAKYYKKKTIFKLPHCTLDQYPIFIVKYNYYNYQFFLLQAYTEMEKLGMNLTQVFEEIGLSDYATIKSWAPEHIWSLDYMYLFFLLSNTLQVLISNYIYNL